jgi:hypothetical protein
MDGSWTVTIQGQVSGVKKHGKTNPFSKAEEVINFEYPGEPGAIGFGGYITAKWSGISSMKWEYTCVVNPVHEGDYPAEVPQSWSATKGVVKAPNQQVPELTPGEWQVAIPAAAAPSKEIEELRKLLQEQDERSSRLEGQIGLTERQLSLTIRENDLLSKKIFALEQDMRNHEPPELMNEPHVQNSIPSMYRRDHENAFASTGRPNYVAPQMARAKSPEMPPTIAGDFASSWFSTASNMLERVLNLIPNDLDMVPAAQLTTPVKPPPPSGNPIPSNAYRVNNDYYHALYKR